MFELVNLILINNQKNWNIVPYGFKYDWLKYPVNVEM
jgi:hypothetical protein